MQSKYEYEQWISACDSFDKNDYDEALKKFISIADTNSKMHFNIGSIFTLLNDHKRAITAFNRAILKDPYFAIAYFQRGVSSFILGDLQSAQNDFDSTFRKLRGNPSIDYQQLGLQFCLYHCEVLFNRGICQLHGGKVDSGLTDLYRAQKAKVTGEHDLIDGAIRVQGKGYSVYSMPPGLLFHPSEIKLRQLKGFNIFRDKCPSFTNNNKSSTLVYQQDSPPPSLYNPCVLPPSPSRTTDESFENLKESSTCSSCQYHNTISSDSSQSSLHSLKKLKIKCHSADTRILLTSADINFQELKLRISDKFNTNPDTIQMSYEDEEHERVLIVDDEDLEMARHINQVKSLIRHPHAATSVEKLEVWL